MSQENLDALADVLEELAGMKQSDPEGYAAAVQDLRGEQADAERAHGEHILGMLDARGQGHDELLELLNRAHRQAAEGKQE